MSLTVFLITTIYKICVYIVSLIVGIAAGIWFRSRL
jgi:hypothetical protein